MSGEGSRSLFILGAPANEAKVPNFKFTNNLVGFGRSQILSAGGGPNNCAYQPDGQGTGGVFKSCFEKAEVAGNVIFGGGDHWPSGNTLLKKRTDVGFLPAEAEPVQGYRLPQKHRLEIVTTDQKDVGANLDAIEAAIQNVR